MDDRKTIWVCGFLHVPSRDIVNEWIMTCWDGRRPPMPEIQSQNISLFFTFQLKQQLERTSAGPRPQYPILLPTDVALDLFETARPDAALPKLL